MNCVKCYQEIPEGSRFCPYCGAEQTAAPVNEQPAETVETASDTPYQDPYNTEGQGSYSYGYDSQNNNDQTSNYQTSNYQTSSYQNNNYQNNGYQNGNYQGTPSYQQDQGDTVNWVPYLVLSIISTLCCCIPFGIVAIVFSAKINSAVTSGNMEEANKAAKTAKIWIIVAVVAGLIVNIAYLVITAMIGSGSYYYYY